MLRKCLTFILTAVLLVCVLTLPIAADDHAMTDGRVTAHLETKDSVNLHTFTMRAAGDAAILVTVEGHWSTLYRWKLTVLAPDGATELATERVKDSADATVVCLRNLAAGTYTILMAATNNFNAKEYTATVYTADAETLPAGDENMVRLMDGPGLICQIDGHSFVKTGAGEAYAALYRNDEGAIVPILISKDKSAVEYVFLTTGDVLKAATFTAKVDGEEYYFTNADWLDKYTDKNRYQSYKEDALYLSEEQHQASFSVEDILDRIEKNEKGMLWYCVSNYWWLGLLLLGIAAGLYWLFHGSSSNDDDTGSYGGGGGGFVPPPDDNSDAYGRPYGPGGPPDVKGI